MIPDDELTRLFQPFQQLDSHPGLPADSAGLGLAIVQAMARAHDTVVIAQSEPSGGLKTDVIFAGASPVGDPWFGGL
jgi:signal transduction histidine kinase